MKVYVAAKLENRDRVRRLYGVLQTAGHEITLDWTVEPDLEGSPEEQTLLMRKWGQDEVEAVQNCDLFILLPDERSRGALVELGIAIGLGKPVLIAEPERFFHCIFFYGKQVLFIQPSDLFSPEKLGFVLRQLATNGPIPWKNVSSMGSAYRRQLVLEREFPAHISPALAQSWAAKVKSLQAALAKAQDIFDENEIVQIKRVTRSCGHVVDIRNEFLIDLKVLHGDAGLAHMWDMIENCERCGFKNSKGGA